MLRASIRAFIKDTSGQFAILFVLMSVPLIGIAAAVVDYAKIDNLRGSLQNAADSAAFAAAHEIRTTNKRNDAISKISTAFVHANIEVKEPDKMELFTKISKDRENVNVKLIYYWKPIFAHHFDQSLIPMQVEANAKVLKNTVPKAQKAQQKKSNDSACRDILNDRKTREILKRYNIMLSEKHCRAMNNAKR